MTTLDYSTETGAIAVWGDRAGGFYGQSFIARGPTLNQVQFNISEWYDGTTDYRLLITTYENGSVGTTLAMSDLVTVSDTGLQTINFAALPLVEGQSYAFLLDTTFGVARDGYAGIGGDLTDPFQDGLFFYNHNEDSGQHVFGPANEIPSIDMAFKLVFGAALPAAPVTTIGTKGADVFTATSGADQIYSGLGSNDTITTFGGNDTIDGGVGDDTIFGGGGDDTITGGKGDDTLNGGGGNDVFLLGTSAGIDTVVGGDGYDTIRATADNTLLRWGSISEIEEVSAGGFAGVKILGTKGSDTLDFSGMKLTGITAIEGSNGDDRIIGSAGDDIISGGTGIDVLTGGAGSDTFVYEASVSSRPGVSVDRITDFEVGIDTIDLSAIDADTVLGGKQSFTFIGDDAFTGGKGELHYSYVNGDTHISADLNGNLTSDFEIILSGVHSMTSNDFFFAA